MIKKIYYSLFLIVVGCSVAEKRPTRVLFAGEIVNPTDKYVVLYQKEKPIDSVALNEDNMFFIQLNNIEEGLYHFNHSPELQYVYLTKGDSLVIRLNTVAFDESLVFTGKGAEINNFLLNIFLKVEEEKSLVDSYYILEPADFGKKIDSLRQSKYVMLNGLLAETSLSEKALSIAKASIDYNSFIAKEKYPFYHKKRTGKPFLHDVADGFYNYRKNITYNDKNLTYFRPYYNFMVYHFGNMSYMTCAENCNLNLHEAKDKLHYNQHTLTLIDSLVKDMDLRDNLFRNVAVEYFLKAKEDMGNNKIFFDRFLQLSGNERHINEITRLYDGIKNMQPNMGLPSLALRSLDGSLVNLSDLSKNKNVVFYFWSGSQLGHFERIARIVNKLASKYPEYDFIGLNWNTDPGQWSSLIESKQLDINLQYQVDNFNQMRETLVFDDFNKAIIIKNGLITNGFGNVNTSFLEPREVVRRR